MKKQFNNVNCATGSPMGRSKVGECMTPDQVKRAIDHFLWLKCGYSPHIQKPHYQGRDYKARANRWILKG